MADISSFSPLWGEWYIKDLIGEGTFGAVYRAEKTEYGNTYVSAVKHITIPCKGMEPDELIDEGVVTDMNSVKDYYDDLRDQFIKEINVCYALRGHTNIVAYEDHCIIPKKNGLGYDIFIRMEYLTALTAYMHSHEMTEEEVIKLGIDICTGLEVLYEKHLLHRDIQPANIFVNSSGIYKLGDFGEAKVLSGASVGMSIRGTYAYMSPEISQGTNAGITADIYSLGLVMYRLLYGNRPPFVPVNIPKVSTQMQEEANTRRFKGELHPVLAYVKSPELCTVVMKACEYKPQDRWQNPEDMKEALIAFKKAMKAPKPKPDYTAPAPTPKPVVTAPQTFVPPPQSIPQASPIFSDQETIPVPAVKPVQQPVGVSSQPMTVNSVKDTPLKKKSKKPLIIALIVAAVLLVICVPVIIGVTAGHENCGKDGDNVKWELDENGLLIISGSGEMNSYRFPKDRPWEGNHNNIKTIIIKDGVTSIGSCTFDSCTSLTSITIPDSVTSIGDGAFNGCTSLTSITMPDSVTEIKEAAFYGCTGITYITVPFSVEEIGANVFGNWTFSQTIYIKGRFFLPDNWSPDWNHLCDAKITWSNEYTLGTVVERGECGDKGNNLEWVLDNNGLLVISGSGNMADYSGSAEAPWYEKSDSVKGIFISKGVTDVGHFSFVRCLNHTAIAVDEANTKYCSLDGVLFSKDMSELVHYPEEKKGSYTIPSGVTSIGDFAFFDSRGLTSITIPDSVKTIGNESFEYSVELESVTIGKGLTSIGHFAFSNCSCLTSMTVDEANEYFSSVDRVLFNKNKTTLICCPGGKTGTYTLPLSVTTIGNAAFKGCTNLTEIAVYGTNTSFSSVDGVLFNKNKTTLICCPGGKTGTYTIPSGVIKIYRWAFGYCESLTSITIPDTVKSMEWCVFGDCTNLTSITIPYSVTSIDDTAFTRWTSSQTIYIKGRRSAPSGWDTNWNKNCNAKIVWNA